VTSAADGDSGGTPIWLTILIALVPLAVALYTGTRAGRAERAAQRAESERERLRVLEQRVADKKREVYEPFLDMLRKLLDPRTRSEVEAELPETLGKFGAWVAVVGSDEAVTAFSRFMQSVYAKPIAPTPVLMRLYADLQLAARRDLGDEETKVSRLDLLGIRISDLHTGDPTLYRAMVLSFDDLCKEQDWAAPWKQVPTKALDAEPLGA
jgi:hypothetical protein